MSDANSVTPAVTLPNGVKMPAIAFGCAFGDWVGGTDFQGFRPELPWRADPLLESIAAAHQVSVGQVVLRWHVQSGRTVLPKTGKAARMAQNLDVLSFALSAEELRAIDALGEGEARRSCADPATVL